MPRDFQHFRMSFRYVNCLKVAYVTSLELYLTAPFFLLFNFYSAEICVELDSASFPKLTVIKSNERQLKHLRTSWIHTKAMQTSAYCRDSTISSTKISSSFKNGKFRRQNLTSWKVFAPTMINARRMIQIAASCVCKLTEDEASSSAG